MPQKRRNDGRDLLEPKKPSDNTTLAISTMVSYGCGEQGRLSRTSFQPQSMLRRLQRTTQNRLSCVTFRVARATDRAQNRAVMCTDHGGNSCFSAPQFGSSVLLHTLARVTFSFRCLPKGEQAVNLRCFCISSQSHRFCSTGVHTTSLSHEDSTTCCTHIFLSHCRQSVSYLVQCNSMHKCTFLGLGSNDLKLKLFSNLLTHCSAPLC